MAEREIKGKDENTKIWIFWEQKEVFKWNKKTLFIVFEGLSYSEKFDKK